MDPIKVDVIRWLNSVVIGLNLCPFAGKPTAENRVRFHVSSALDEEGVLQELADEMALLDKTPAGEIETTLVIVPQLLQSFFDYSQCLAWAESMLKRNGWKGVYQLASFHPEYCFAGSDIKDVENLTNRAPYPILHIIREESLSRALAYVEDVEGIPLRNQQRMRMLSEQEKYVLFPYLFSEGPH